MQQEINQLKQQLAEYTTSNGDIVSLSPHEHLGSALVDERKLVASLRVQLEERTTELDTVRKKLNREASLNGVTTDSSKAAVPASPSSKSDLSATKEEIKGLKYAIISCWLGDMLLTTRSDTLSRNCRRRTMRYRSRTISSRRRTSCYRLRSTNCARYASILPVRNSCKS